jgi:hypothetical protein
MADGVTLAYVHVREIRLCTKPPNDGGLNDEADVRTTATEVVVEGVGERT